ncbi:hypothetical protein STAN_4099 [Streptomyces sp. CBMAI 2042]|nr:hypothetical protein STAN_4099 [Streptomyces sp. CBMAI 2042]
MTTIRNESISTGALPPARRADNCPSNAPTRAKRAPCRAAPTAAASCSPPTVSSRTSMPSGAASAS